MPAKITDFTRFVWGRECRSVCPPWNWANRLTWGDAIQRLGKLIFFHQFITVGTLLIEGSTCILSFLIFQKLMEENPFPAGRWLVRPGSGTFLVWVFTQRCGSVDRDMTSAGLTKRGAL